MRLLKPVISWSLLLGLSGSVLAADGSTSSSDSSTATTTPTKTASESASTTATRTGPATHTISVGSPQDPHQYSPHSIKADVGDLVVFAFYPRNHSVVQADYQAPCVPAQGDYFYSGIFNSFNERDGQLVGDPPTWTLTVNSTEPTFFYCTAIDSCIKEGMVGAINPNDTMTWEAQEKKAKEYPYMLVPGQSAPAEGETPNSPSPTESSKPTAAPSSHHGLSGGAIAGIVIGCVAGVSILGALLYVLGRNRVYRKWLTSEDGRNDRTRQWALGGGGGGSSTGPKSEMGATGTGIDGTTLGSPVHASFAGSEVGAPYYDRHQSEQFAQSPPSHWSWGSGKALGSPKQMNSIPQELSSRNELVELEASDHRPATPDVKPPR